VPFAILSCQNYEEYASTPYKQDASRCGSLLYASGFYMLVSHIMGQLDLYLASSLAIWYTAIDLFMVGHVIEGNVGAMTLTILFKCVRFNSKVKA